MFIIEYYIILPTEVTLPTQALCSELIGNYENPLNPRMTITAVYHLSIVENLEKGEGKEEKHN